MHISWPNIRRWNAFARPPSRRTMIVVAVLVLLALAHPFLLRLLTWPVTAAGSSAACDYFCLRGSELGVDGFEPFQAAAEWYGQSAGRKILLLLPRDSRIVEVGAIPSFEQTCRKALAKRGIPPADVFPIRADALNVWDEAHAMDGWLKAHPGSTVGMACSPYSSGRLRFVFNKVAGPVDGERVRLVLLPDPQRPVEAWWKSRAGVKDFMFAWLDMAFTWANGDDAGPRPAGAAVFQSEIRAQIGEAPP